MGSLIPSLITSLVLIGSTFAQNGQNLYFANYPTEVQLGTKYVITWTGGDDATPVNLALLRGAAPDPVLVTEISSSATGGYCDWTPDEGLEEADDYLLGIAQNTDIVYGRPITVVKTLASSTDSATMAASTTSPTASPSSPTSSVSAAPAGAIGASSSVVIVDPTPTSSFDAPRAEDSSLTVNDKVAIGLGIPIALLVLGTVGYWRAVKFFLHRKITGEQKLPLFDGGQNGNLPSIVVGSGLRRDSGRNSTWSQAPSLWGATSRRSSAVPQKQLYTSNETELLTTPPQPLRPPVRPDSPASARPPSALRTAWTPV